MSARDFIKSFKFQNIILSADAFGVLDQALKELTRKEANELVKKVIEKVEREHRMFAFRFDSILLSHL
jgi:hypothetical protein